MMNVIILHGAYGYPEENWFPWLKAELMKRGIPCIVPRFPTPRHQSLKTWYRVFEKHALQYVSPQSIIIGHSLGALFLLRCISKFNLSLFAGVLVGAFINRVNIAAFDQVNQTFLSCPIFWEELAPACAHWLVYYSYNDPYVSSIQFDCISNQLHARRIIISNAGHFNKNSGYLSFAHLLRELINLKARVAASYRYR